MGKTQTSDTYIITKRLKNAPTGSLQLNARFGVSHSFSQQSGTTTIQYSSLGRNFGSIVRSTITQPTSSRFFADENQPRRQQSTTIYSSMPGSVFSSRAISGTPLVIVTGTGTTRKESYSWAWSFQSPLRIPFLFCIGSQHHDHAFCTPYIPASNKLTPIFLSMTRNCAPSTSLIIHPPKYPSCPTFFWIARTENKKRCFSA